MDPKNEKLRLSICEDFDKTIPNNTDNKYIFVHGMEGSTGDLQVWASMQGDMTGMMQSLLEAMFHNEGLKNVIFAACDKYDQFELLRGAALHN